MKIKKKIKLYGDSSKKSVPVAAWAITDADKFQGLAKQSATESRRAPEFWLRDGDRRMIYFVDGDAVAAFKAYNLMVNGRPQKFIAPPQGKPDLLATALNLRPVTYFLFRILDLEGYTPLKGKNAGKLIKNIPRFYVVGSRIYEQIKLQCVESSGSALNAGYTIACRSGSGPTSVYTFIPRAGDTKKPEIKKAIANFPKWQNYYQPVSVEQQKNLVATQGASLPE